MSKKIYYFPILKTSDAELKAYGFLDPLIQRHILPVFELTKSRKTKQNPESKLEKKLDKLYALVKKKPFILDLTTEVSYSNKEIDRMIHDGSNGYKRWTEFLNSLKEKFPFIIPTVHYHPLKTQDIKKQTVSLGNLFKYLAFRADVFQDKTIAYINNFLSFCKELKQNTKIIIILDGSFIPIDRHDRLNEFKENIKKIRSRATNDKIQAFVYAFSSFPKSVRSIGYNGGDAYGEFKITENSICPSDKMYHGDYGSIHPKKYDTGGGSWIPRIDAISSNKEKFFYHRYRRNSGSYARCAQKLSEDEKYRKIDKINAWGDEEIQHAIHENPRGKNPSHWIAVRSNLYMTQQCLRLKELNKYLSLSW